VPAQVETVEYFGADTIVGARIGAAALLVRAPGQHRLARRAVHLAWDARDQPSSKATAADAAPDPTTDFRSKPTFHLMEMHHA
jgi:hypothetical protein